MSVTEARSCFLLFFVLLALNEFTARAAGGAPQDCLVRVYLQRESSGVLYQRQLFADLRVSETALLNGIAVDPRGFVASYVGDLAPGIGDPQMRILIQTADGLLHDAELVGMDERISLAVLHTEATKGCRLRVAHQFPQHRLLLVTSSERRWNTMTPVLVKVEDNGPLPEARLKVTNPGLKAESCAGEGGFLFSEDGSFSGIITHTHSHWFSHKLAVLEVLPAAVIEHSVQEVISRRSNIPAGWLGVYFPEGSSPQVRIARVVPGSPAAESGLRAGDLIQRVENQRIRTARELARAIRWRGPDSHLALQVVRRGEARQVRVRLSRRELEEPTFAFAMEMLRQEGAGRQMRLYRTVLPLPLRLGLFMETVSGGVPARFPQIEPGGLLINSVLPGSTAEQAGFQSGDVIFQVDGQSILSLSDFLHQAEQAGDALQVEFLREGRVVSSTLPLR